MTFDFEMLPQRACYRLLTSTVVPRPIALVTSRSPAGAINAAPFSFFNVMGHDPPIVVLGIERAAPGSLKHTARNIRETHDFVVNLVSEAMLPGMLKCAEALPEGVSELEHAGFSAAQSSKIAVPRIAVAPASLECRETVTLGVGEGRSLVVAQVLAMHLQDDAFEAETQRVLDKKLNLIGRMAGDRYLKTTASFAATDLAARQDR